MLTQSERDIIKATVPLLEQGGEQLTQHFYNIMLSEYTDVRPLFNQAAQSTGRQPRALANSLLMYAKTLMPWKTWVIWSELLFTNMLPYRFCLSNTPS